MKVEFSSQTFKKYSNIKFHSNLSTGSRAVPYGQINMTKLKVTFHNFVNAPKNDKAKPNLSALNKEVTKFRCISFTYTTCLTQSKELTQKNTMSWSIYRLNSINVLLYLAAVIHNISL
jgi:hypothetical protein